MREALRQLEAQGLVTLSPSRSAVVTALDPDDLHAIYRLRILIEPELAALSTPDRTDAELSRLDGMVRATFDHVLGEAFWEPHRAHRAHAHDELVHAARSRDPQRVHAAVREHLQNLTTMLDEMSTIDTARRRLWSGRDATA